MSAKRILIIEFVVLAVVLALFFSATKPVSAPVSTVALMKISSTTLEVPHFPQTPIEAQSAFIFDVKTDKILFEKDADTPRPLASLTKLMSALTAAPLLPDYLLIHINMSDIEQDGDSGLFPNEAWTPKNLLDFSLVTSSNDGIHAIADAAGEQISSTSTDPEALFVDRMNQNARMIGLTETTFYNESGLDLSTTTSGAYGSARDVAHLIDYILRNKPNLLEATSLMETQIASQSEMHQASNTDLSLVDIPNVLASKTGYTDLAGGNLAVAFNAGIDHPVIVTLLGSSYEGRFSDLSALVKSTLKYLDETAATTSSLTK